MKFRKFLLGFKRGQEIYIEDSILWYCLNMDTYWYLSLSINQRINFKQSYLI